MKGRGHRAFWVLLVASLCAFALAMGYRWFERGGAFDLDIVRVRGIRRADSTVVCQAVKPLFGRSIWQIDVHLLERELSAIPGIDSAVVRRAPLRTLILELKVSRPSFTISDSSGRVAVSSAGEFLPDRFISDSLPVVEAWTQVTPSVSERLAQWLCGEEMISEEFTLNYTQRGVSVLVNERCRVLLGSEDLEGRWAEYTVLAPSLAEVDDLREVDMRYSGQAVLRSSVACSDGRELQ
ncbi:MAG: FtsQ-type POTRA domain-containing protein [Candidatus Aegiribacteria sp.]